MDTMNMRIIRIVCLVKLKDVKYVIPRETVWNVIIINWILEIVYKCLLLHKKLIKFKLIQKVIIDKKNILIVVKKDIMNQIMILIVKNVHLLVLAVFREIDVQSVLKIEN